MREKRFRAIWDRKISKLTYEDDFTLGAIRNLVRYVDEHGKPDRLDGKFADEPWTEDQISAKSPEDQGD